MFAPRSRAGRSVAPLVLASLLVLSAAGIAHAQATVQVVVAFNESLGQNPEGIAINRTGAIFVSVSPLGDLWRIPPGSDDPQPFGHVDGIVPGRDFGLLGLAVDVFGNVYGAVQSADPAANGVWRFDRFTGDATRLPGTDSIQLANGLAFDKQANLYVTDSRSGAIWRIPWGGSAAVWAQDTALTGNGSLGLNIGANGIAVQRGVLTVTNTERRTILQIPKVAGQPGSISVLTTDMYFATQQIPPQYGTAAAIGSPLLVFGIFVLFMNRVLLGDHTRFVTHGGKGRGERRPARLPLEPRVRDGRRSANDDLRRQLLDQRAVPPAAGPRSRGLPVQRGRSGDAGSVRRVAI